MKVELSTGSLILLINKMVLHVVYVVGEHGVIDGAFGSSGKFRVTIPGEEI